MLKRSNGKYIKVSEAASFQKERVVDVITCGIGICFRTIMTSKIRRREPYAENISINLSFISSFVPSPGPVFILKVTRAIQLG